MNYYKIARGIFYTLEVKGAAYTAPDDDTYGKVQQSLNVIKRRNLNQQKQFKSSKKTLSIWRVS